MRLLVLVLLLAGSGTASATVTIDPSPVLGIVAEVLAFIIGVGLPVLMLWFTAKAFRWARGEVGDYSGGGQDPDSEVFVCESCGDMVPDDEAVHTDGADGDEGVICQACAEL